MAQTDIEARIAAAADQADRLRAAFPEMPQKEFRKKAHQILKIMGVDWDIATIALTDILDDEPDSTYTYKIVPNSDTHLDEGEDGEDR